MRQTGEEPHRALDPYIECYQLGEGESQLLQVLHHLCTMLNYIYRVFHQLADLVWVDLDLGCSIILLSHFCQNLICLSRSGQTAELLRSKSTQPRRSES